MAAFTYSDCRAGALKIGDQVLTPSHRWETVTSLAVSDTCSRAVQVSTDATGTGFPWTWVAGHRVLVRRPTPVAQPYG